MKLNYNPFKIKCSSSRSLSPLPPSLLHTDTLSLRTGATDKYCSSWTDCKQNIMKIILESITSRGTLLSGRHAVHVRSQAEQTENRTRQSTGVPSVEPKPLTTHALHEDKKNGQLTQQIGARHSVLSATLSKQRFQRHEA